MSHAHNLSLSIVSHSKLIYLQVNASMGLERIVCMFAGKGAPSLGPTYRFNMYGMNGEEDSRYKTAEIVEKYCAHSGMETEKETNKLVYRRWSRQPTCVCNAL